MKRNKKSPKIGLALGSGGARGLAHIGVIKALLEANVKIDYLAGVSMGSMIGAGYAAGMDIRDMESLALKTDWKKLLSLLDPTILTKGMIDGSKIEKFVSSCIGNINFSEAKLPFAVVATDIANKEKIVISEGRIAKAVRASISFPFVFAPYQYDGRVFLDGVLVDPVPVSLVKEMGADYVIAVNTYSELSHCFGGKTEAAVIKCAEERVVVNNHEAEESGHQSFLSKVNGMLKMPNIAEIGIQSLAVMEKYLALPELLKADLIVTPQLSDIKAFEFVHAKEIISRGEDTMLKLLSKKKIC